MFSATQNMPRGPLSGFMRGRHEPDMTEFVQRGREALSHGASDVERFLAENAGAVCIAGVILGTFVDRRFLLLPLAVGGLRLWRSM